MIDASKWKNVKIDTDHIHMSTLERVAKLFVENMPGFEFGFPTLEELEEWREKHWEVVTPQEWPERLRNTTGFTEKDGLIWFRGHIVVARPEDIDKRMRAVEMEAQERRWQQATQRSTTDSKTGLSIVESEETTQTVPIKRRGRQKKVSS